VQPTFFATAEQFRAWLEAHHEDQTELLVGFYKKGSGRPSISWHEAVDEALCFGWIDGVRRGIDDESYSIRFTPRTKRSTWSAVNIARARELIEEGRMAPAGRAAFEQRADERSALYSYEQRREARLDPEQALSRARPRVGLVPEPPAVVPAERAALGRERQAARDARAAARDADRGLGRRSADQAAQPLIGGRCASASSSGSVTTLSCSLGSVRATTASSGSGPWPHAIRRGGRRADSGDPTGARVRNRPT
jgi:hypothetical protein